MEKKLAKGLAFHVIIYGDVTAENDFYVIPYAKLQHLFVDGSQVKGKEGDKRKRWMGNIRVHVLRITNSEHEVQLLPYYGNRELLGRAAGADQEYLSDVDAMTEASSSFMSISGDSRELALRQIRERRGQKKFRSHLIKRYGSRCMISECRIMDVVEAAHVKAYRGAHDHDLSNGLLLRADLHTLFDLDLIGIEPECGADTLTDSASA